MQKVFVLVLRGKDIFQFENAAGAFGTTYIFVRQIFFLSFQYQAPLKNVIFFSICRNNIIFVLRGAEIFFQFSNGAFSNLKMGGYFAPVFVIFMFCFYSYFELGSWQRRGQGILSKLRIIAIISWYLQREDF